MESSSSRQEAEERRQVEIRRQIARLQAELADPSAASHSSSSYGAGGSGDVTGSPKRKPLEGNLLVPRSPSPSKLLCYGEVVAFLSPTLSSLN